MSQVDCATPVSMATLVDYWAGDTSTADAERFEECGIEEMVLG